MSSWTVALAAAAWALAGPVAAAAVFATPPILRIRRARREPFPLRLVLIVLLIEIRSGRSVLAALRRAGERVAGWPELGRVARVAEISGPEAAIETAGPELRPVLAQLVRAHRSGASLDHTVRRLLEEDLAEERARNLARARTLPVRLMLPVTLLMLPGLVLLLYAPSIFRLFDDLTGALF
ncbi:MAG: type II secretion system F family protein [Acidimicrobiia bacterium]|nr:type II secretion system F family protein [Acidimicrobiia bacterium]